jgi:GT2 family glycosyltransferase
MNDGGVSIDKTVSVVIVCFNRPKDAADAVRSLLNQTVKPWEIIVVDDGSNPPLNLPFRDISLKLLHLDREVGLSNARTIGTKMASGVYVAFMDDDAVAGKTWISEICENIGSIDIFGGAILPLYKAVPPDWWNEKDFGEYAGVGNIWQSHGRNQIWGTNMVIKKEVFSQIGFFNPLFGRQKGKLTSCEEEDFIERAKRRGLIVRFLPTAQVYHKVNPGRMTLRYLIKRSYYAGKSQRIMSGSKLAKTSFDLLHCLILMASPLTMISSNIDRIQKLVWLSWLLGLLF